MSELPVEAFAREVPQGRVDSVRSACAMRHEARGIAMEATFDTPDGARTSAASIKDFVLANLGPLLQQFEQQCIANGVHVYWAADAEAARRIVLDICSASGEPGLTIVKGKSMATEEIHLNEALSAQGFDVVETDLGEYVVQLDDDTPSHIVAPIIHKTRTEVAASFQRHGIGGETDDPTELTMEARAALRAAFRRAKIGISGVNFGIAETGRLVIVENEGNNRLSTTAPDVHIAVMGIEKLLPSERDLPLFLKLLTASATGQKLTTYVHLISGPRAEEMDGPKEVHVVLLDNGRSEVLHGPYRSILRCIRCGACLNVCPVYRQATGHAYGHVYSGPLGAVLAPAMDERHLALAKASTLCGACEEVCPVRIPIPDMLLRLRSQGVRKRLFDEPPWHLYAGGATSPKKWRAGLKLLPIAGQMVQSWTEYREFPDAQGRSFREWWRTRP
jgi:L-lactate dehydrogenase complex protein LldF